MTPHCLNCHAGIKHLHTPDHNIMTYEPLRHVRLHYHPEYELKIWDTGYCDNDHRTVLHYEFSGPDGVIFEREDFRVSTYESIDSDKTLISLLGFITLRPGDTDADYFADYNEVQRAFADGMAEELAIYAHDPEPGEVWPRFIDVERRHLRFARRRHRRRQ